MRFVRTFSKHSTIVFDLTQIKIIVGKHHRQLKESSGKKKKKDDFF